jgi:hypothetical protein
MRKLLPVLILCLVSFSGCSSGPKSISIEEALEKIGLEDAVFRCATTLDGNPTTLSDSTNLQVSLDFISSEDGKSIENYDEILWSSQIDSERDQELAQVCKNLIENDVEFSNLYKQEYLEKLNKAKAESQADAAKFQPLLDKLDDKFYKAGMGGVRDFLAASATTYNLIKQGAAYSLTGVSRGEIEEVDCVPTERSFWSGGVPGNWWSCWIDFLGSNGEYFSVEFNGNSWSGKPDGGSTAGRELKGFEIPQDLLEWIRKSS